MLEITFVTGNKEKLREAKEILNKDIKINNIDIDLIEVQEIDGKKVAIEKAKTAYNIVKKPLFVEDTSLYIQSWNKLPGTFNKWFMRTVGNEGIIRMLKDFNDRSANAETVIAYHDGKKIRTFIGTVKGEISDKVRGENGFGWDKIFIPNGLNKTQAELSASEKNSLSTRRKAIEKLKRYLNEK